jgi:predicted enzyme related to lactoylglutathione lyase
MSFPDGETYSNRNAFGMLTGMRDDAPGQIRWVDLTVPDAERIREFYREVVGWDEEPVAMAEYNDWCMVPMEGTQPVAGICHARGANASLPPVWLIYITVADLQVSVDRCRQLGGEVIFGPKLFGTEGKWCVIRDPAGAVAALFEANAVA